MLTATSAAGHVYKCFVTDHDCRRNNTNQVGVIKLPTSKYTIYVNIKNRAALHPGTHPVLQFAWM